MQIIYRLTCAYFGVYVFFAALLGSMIGAAVGIWIEKRGKR